MLVYDIQTLAVHFFPPAGNEDRERRVVSIAELIGMINKAQQQTGPKWKRYYLAHRDQEIARQKAYRAAHRNQVQQYNRQYYRSRKQMNTAPLRKPVLIQEASKCST